MMTVELPTMAPLPFGSSSLSVVSDFFDGELSADELNEIAMAPFATDGSLADDYDFLTSALGEQVVSMVPIAMLEPNVPLAPLSDSIMKINAVNNKDVLTMPNKKRNYTKAEPAKKKRRVSESSNSETETPAIRQPLALLPPVALVSPSSSVSGDAFMPTNTLVNIPVLSTVTPPPAPVSAAEPTTPEPTSSSSRQAQLVPPTGPANTSFEHIRMLVSENGPAECAKAVVKPVNTSDGRYCADKARLTQEQRAQASRDRNRVHARNTRLRKTAYVEELKRTLLALGGQRDATVLEEQQRLMETRSVRFQVLKEFLNLRGSNSSQANRWGAILMPEFTLTLPSIINSLHGTVLVAGVDQVMAESGDFSNFLQTLGSSGKVSVQFETGTLFIMDGNDAVIDWNATTVGVNANNEIKFRGNVRAHFNPESNKIVSATMLFDTGYLLSQQQKK